MSFSRETIRQINLTEQRIDSLPSPEISADLVSPFLALSGLRGFWPMSSFNESGNAYDLSGQGRVLSYNGNPTYNYDGVVPYIDLDGTGDWLSRADEAGLDILGTETYVAAAARGLTIGGWFYFNNALGATEGMIAKWDSSLGNHRSYMLRRQADGTIIFRVSDNGAGSRAAQSTASPAATQWFFAVGRFDPSVELALFVDAEKSTNLVAIPASAFNSNAALWVGRVNETATDYYMTGRASLCFLCTAMLSDAIISSLFQQTRAAFRV